MRSKELLWDGTEPEGEGKKSDFFVFSSLQIIENDDIIDIRKSVFLRNK